MGWQTTPPHPGIGVLRGSCWMDGRFWIVGGITVLSNSTRSADIRSWAPGEPSWTLGVPIPYGGWSGGGLTGHNGKLYLYGGVVSGQGNLPFIMEYSPAAGDPSFGTWTDKSNLPVWRQLPCKMEHSVNGEIWIIGGHNGIGPIARADAYNPATDTYRSFTTGVNTIMGGVAAFLSDSRIHYTGGHNGGFNTTHWSMDPVSPPGSSITHGSGLPAGSTIYNGTSMVLGGGLTPGVRDVSQRWYVGFGMGPQSPWYSWGFTAEEPFGQEEFTVESNLYTDNIVDGSGQAATYNATTGQIRYSPATGSPYGGTEGYIASGMTDMNGIYLDPNMVKFTPSSGPPPFSGTITNDSFDTDAKIFQTTGFTFGDSFDVDVTILNPTSLLQQDSTDLETRIITSISSNDLQFTYIQTEITDIIPDPAPYPGGVTIKGTLLDKVKSVYMDGKKASFRIKSDTEIHAVIPFNVSSTTIDVYVEFDY